MKLISCHIEHFGRLADFTYYFEDGLNILLEENGWGKSTFAAFLKVMFYGFEGENKRNEEANERLRYAPWDGGVYGGSVTFSAKNGTYRLLRTFGNRKKEDTFRLVDASTGLVCADFSDKIGEELFGIDRESFSRTVFWSQKDHETEATTLIQAKIGDLSREQDDLPSYDMAMRQLRREIDRLSPDRASGQIRRKEEQASLLEAEAARLPGLRRELDEVTASERRLARELSQIRAQRQEYTVAATAQYPSPGSEEVRTSPLGESRRGEELQSSDDAQLERLQTRLDASRNIDDAQLERLQTRLDASQNRLKAQERAGRHAAAAGRREREEYLRIRRERKELERTLQKTLQSSRDRSSRLRTGGASALALAALLLILVLTGILPSPILAITVLLLTGGASAIYSSMHTGDEGPSEELDSLRAEEKEIHASLQRLLGRMHRAQEEAAAEQQMLSSLERRIAALKSGAAQRAETAPALTAREISDRLTPSLAEFDLKEEKCRLRMREASQQAEDLRHRIGDCSESAARLHDLRDEIHTLRSNYETCVQTAKYLEKARSSFTSRYMNPFLRSFRRYYSLLTGEAALDIETDADFNITVTGGGLPRNPSLLSEGTRDLISLCRRMAMIDAMYPGEKPFLLLDDPFSNLDDERIKGGLRFLQSASLEYQILYLTCHESRI